MIILKELNKNINKKDKKDKKNIKIEIPSRWSNYVVKNINFSLKLLMIIIIKIDNLIIIKNNIDNEYKPIIIVSPI